MMAPRKKKEVALCSTCGEPFHGLSDCQPSIRESWEATVQARKVGGAARGKMGAVDALRLVGAMAVDLPQTAALVLSLSGVLEALPAEERREFDGKIASLVKVLVLGLNPAALEAAGWKVGQ